MKGIRCGCLFFLFNEVNILRGDPFYKTKKWIKKRNGIMRKYSYECQESKRFGIRVQAEMIHHIYPRDKYPELSFIEWNLLPLTNKKHNSFHDRNSNEVIGNGLYWQQKRKKEFENFYNPPHQINLK